MSSLKNKVNTTCQTHLNSAEKTLTRQKTTAFAYIAYASMAQPKNLSQKTINMEWLCKISYRPPDESGGKNQRRTVKLNNIAEQMPYCLSNRRVACNKTSRAFVDLKRAPALEC